MFAYVKSFGNFVDHLRIAPFYEKRPYSASGGFTVEFGKSNKCSVLCEMWRFYVNVVRGLDSGREKW